MPSDSSAAVVSTVRAVVNSDGGVLMDTKAGLMFSLNHAGATIWRALEAGRSMTEIAEILVDTFNISRERAVADVAQFLDDLRGQKLIV